MENAEAEQVEVRSRKMTPERKAEFLAKRRERERLRRAG